MATATIPHLYLRVDCPGCDRSGLAPVDRLDRGDCTCNQCRTVLQMPPPETEIRGLEPLRRWFHKACDLDCPVCNRVLHPAPTDVGKQRKCPGCHSELMLQFLAVNVPQMEPESASGSIDIDVDRDKSVHSASPNAQSNGRKPQSHPNTAEPANDLTDSPPPPPPPRQNSTPTASTTHDTPDVQVYETTSRKPSERARSLNGFVTSSPRLVFWVTYWCIQIGLPLVVLFGTNIVGGIFIHAAGERNTMSTMPFVGCFSCVVLVVTALPWTAFLLARHAAALIVSAIRCPGCGFQMDAVSRWSVGSFNDHRERHIFLAWNPIDKGYTGHINCPQCDATIRIR